MIPCEYAETCPAAMDCCQHRHPDVQCIPHILEAHQDTEEWCECYESMVRDRQELDDLDMTDVWDTSED